MIRTLLTSLCLVLYTLAIAQPPAPEKKSITVVGSAEMEIIPDEIYFTIVLQEYMNKDKVKVGIDALEKELQASVSGAGISKENLQIENVFGQQWIYKKRKQHDFLASKRYVIKLSDLSKIDGILDKIDAQGIDQAYVSRYSHSKIEQYRKDLKIQAIKNAKEKAKYLLEAIGEQLGEAININESVPSYGFETNYGLGGAGITLYDKDISNSSYKSYKDGSNSEIINFQTIQLKFEVSAEFKIK
jgi:uncharacterized protein YggE